MFSVSADDAQTWQLQVGDSLTVKAGEISVTLPVKLVDYLAEGCVGYPVGQVPALTAQLSQPDVMVSFYKAGAV